MIKRVVITVRYNIVTYLIGEGFSNLLKNKKSTWAALTIMCMSMFMFGIFFVLGENINFVAAQVEKEQGMQVWLDYDVTDTQIADIQTKIRAIQGTNTVEYISNTETLNEQKEILGMESEYFEGLESYFQDSFLVTLTNLELNSSVQEQIKNIEGVESIRSSNDTIEALVSITKGIRMVTFAILIILVIISIFIITNTIKLTVHARRKEISIMKYVGATNSFIRWPFIVEGIIIGLISSIITVFIVGLLYNTVTDGVMQSAIFQDMNLKLYTFKDMFKMLILTYVGLGAGIGIVRKYNFNEKILRSIKTLKEEIHMVKKIMIILIVCILLVVPVMSFASDLQNKRNDILNSINDAKDKQNEVKNDITQTQSEINKLNDEISEKEYEIEIITEELNKLKKEVDELSEKLKEAEEHYDEQYDLLGKRLAAQAKRGNASYLDVLLKSKSLTDFISKYHILEQIAKHDTQLLNDIKEEQETIMNAKKEIEKKKEDVEIKQKQLKNEELALINRKTTKNKYMSQLSAEEQKLQNEISQFNKKLKEVDNQILQEAINNNGGNKYTGGKLEWPVPASHRITSGFGYRGSAATGGVGTSNHNGYDIGAPHNSNIIAAESGVVTKVVRACSHDYPKTYSTKCNCGGGYGNYLMIQHGGLTTLYGHCASISVNVGQRVNRGDVIAKVGSAGWSTGYHLHFSVITGSSYVDPGNYLGK